MTIEVRMISRNEIEFGDRRREAYGDINALAASIKEHGLIQPIAVMSVEANCDLCDESASCHIHGEPEEGCYSGKSYLLLAGGRRFKATEVAGLDLLPCRVYPSVTSYVQQRAIELEENIARQNLSYKEEVALKAELHALRQMQRGAVFPGQRVDTTSQGAGWSQGDTARELGIAPSTFSADLELAKALKENPSQFDGIENKSDALKMLKKKKQTQDRQQLAKAVEEKLKGEGSESKIHRLVSSYILRDFFDGVSTVPDNSINIVEIDPPYGMDLKAMKMKDGPLAATDLSHYNEVPSDEYVDFMRRVFKESYRVMTENSWVICWFAHEPWFETVYSLMREAGFVGNRMVGVWVKKTGQTMQPGKYLANVTEFFFYMRKGSPVMGKPGHLNAFNYSGVASQRKTHPTERPLELMKDILNTFGQPGYRILVPFLGSGKTILAAEEVHMSAFGFDLSPAYRDSFIVQVRNGLNEGSEEVE